MQLSMGPQMTPYKGHGQHKETTMKRAASTKTVLLALGIALVPTLAAAQEAKSSDAQQAKGKTCRMEQQCHWENFKKICIYVKVCR